MLKFHGSPFHVVIWAKRQLLTVTLKTPIILGSLRFPPACNSIWPALVRASWTSTPWTMILHVNNPSFSHFSMVSFSQSHFPVAPSASLFLFLKRGVMKGKLWRTTEATRVHWAWLFKPPVMLTGQGLCHLDFSNILGCVCVCVCVCVGHSLTVSKTWQTQCIG